MSGEKSTLGNFHFPATKGHPVDSVGNQQIIVEGKQEGSLEYILNAETGTFDIAVSNTKGKMPFSK